MTTNVATLEICYNVKDEQRKTQGLRTRHHLPKPVLCNCPASTLVLVNTSQATRNLDSKSFRVSLKRLSLT